MNKEANTTSVELNWNDPVPTKVNDFGRIEDGNNRIRIVSNPFQTVVHYLNDKTGKKRRLNCTRSPGCPACTTGSLAKSNYFITAINRKTNTVQVFEVGQSVFNSIKELALNADWGSPSGYDVNITRTGTGMATRYAVNPAPHKPLTQEEKTLVATFKDRVDVLKFAQPETVDTMNEKLGVSPAKPDWNF